ncbi:MAG: hypothetical protein JHC87_01065 [Thermoleophilaceae bacterium]|nr:hypothetical protein [Thermoleophilaceae bacterium]
MAKLEAKIEKQLAATAAADETVLAAVKVTPEGGIRRIAVAGARGVAASAASGHNAVSGTVAMQTSEMQGSSEGPGEVKLAGVMAMGVTNRRVALLSLSAMTGSPKDLLFEMPFDQIKGFEFDQGKAVKLKMLNLRFELASGDTLTFEVPRGYLKDGVSTAEALQAALGR